jgi:hypothetical protein
VVLFKRLGIIEIHGKLTVNSNRSKMAHGSVVFETENLREETGRSFLVTRRHNSMIQRYRHIHLPGNCGHSHVYDKPDLYAFPALCLLAMEILARMIEIRKVHCESQHHRCVFYAYRIAYVIDPVA